MPPDASRAPGSPSTSSAQGPAGRPRASASRRTAPSSCTPARRRTARATKRRSRRSSPRELGVEPDAVEVRWGDSFEIPEGVGTYASRSITVGGSAALLAARELKARLDAGEAAPLEASTRFELPGPVFSFGAYVAAVEVEPETGVTHLRTLVAVDDCGRVINPLLADGQVQGGVVQAIGECFHEQVGYDDDGQPLAVNLYEYQLPTAQSLPELTTALRETPSPLNPLGAKGVGEGGSIGTPAAVANAVADALTPLGILHLDPPYTASRVWGAMRTAALSGSPTAD